ncbi:MAG: hypothetical protein Q9198_010569, partial [Flavoplaca austrocitrina]
MLLDRYLRYRYPHVKGNINLSITLDACRSSLSSFSVSEQVIQTSSIMFSAIYRGLWRSFGRIDSNYELELQVAQMRKQPGYLPEDIPPPTSFGIKCHPKADQVCAELDEYFFKNWPWEDKAAGQKFLRSETNRWACLALPNARDDRIYDSVRVNTLLFLLD